MAIARGGVIGRIGPEITPECDCGAGWAGLAGVGAAGNLGAAAPGAGAWVSAVGGLAAAAFAAGFGAGAFTEELGAALTGGFGAALVSTLAGVLVPVFAAALSFGLVFRAVVNFFSVSGSGSGEGAGLALVFLGSVGDAVAAALAGTDFAGAVIFLGCEAAFIATGLADLAAGLLSSPPITASPSMPLIRNLVCQS